MKILSEKSILLCCKANSCPIIELNNNQVNIKDVFGGQVNITLEEAEMIGQALNLLKNNIKPNKEIIPPSFITINQV